ncbi:LysR family transcriptional regulator [Acetobacteraceae bacterium KSS8]|uniref:LysR family transcriptional regulator n=1 Tax=Endosaccharibacter trunci TaxID=2812733 RepID=A0ABT1W9I1_9PROT|nr:LysR family transcriptional regulator [Acetobacteraceae bacterium KSS8]
MDRLDAMMTLLAVVETGSFSAASRRLRVPVTTVSRRVAELESHLRTQLLQRTTRKLSLTDAGVPYVLACRQVIEQIEEAERTASGEYRSPRGTLTITAPAMLGRIHLVPIVADFMAQYADIQLTCRFNDRVLDMQDEHVDVAIRIGELADSRHRARRVGTIHRLVAASPDYLGRRGTPRTPADLDEHDCVAFHGFDPPGHWLFPNTKEMAATPIPSRVMFDTIDSVIEAGLAGVGLIRVFCYHIMRALRAGDLKEVLPDFVPPGMPVHILHKGEGLVPLKVRAFIDFCAPRLEAALAR